MEDKNKEIQQLRQDFDELLKIIFQATDQEKRIDEIELQILKTLLRIGKQLIMAYVGFVVTRSEKIMKGEQGVRYRNKGLFSRTYFSIFGPIRFQRNKVYIEEERKIIYPADKVLGMPKEEYSYNLQDWIGYSTTDTDFRSSVELINRILGHNILEMQAERISNKLSEEVEVFYEEGAILPQEEGSFFAAGFDDKGVPILPAEVNREIDSSGVRLGKGQKKGVKKSSTVSVTYSFDPNIRKAEDVIASLFKEKDHVTTKNDASLEPKAQAKNKHIRAFLSDKKKAMDYGFENIQKRSADETKNIVVLIDGDRGLEKAIDRAVESKDIKDRIIFKVLDFIHVTEYLWKAANIYFGEKSPHRLNWVKEQCLLLLQGETNTVLKNLQKLIQHGKYMTAKHRVIKSVIRYVSNHTTMMNYKECLARGFPISTGAIESACGHFVQSRMERNGMRWSLKGAKNMLNLRAVNKNKDWDTYMQYYIEKKQVSDEFTHFKKAA